MNSVMMIIFGGWLYNGEDHLTMTTIHIPFRNKPSRASRPRQPSPEAKMTVAYDPCLDREKGLYYGSMPRDEDRETALIGLASNMWAGIHWYRQLPDRSQLESA